MPIMNSIQTGFRIVENEIELVKEGFNDWAIHLQRENNELKARVDFLERRLQKVEFEMFRREAGKKE